jgi:hypothetical protein
MTDNSNTNKFDNLQEKNEQVLNNISQLQKQEKELYNSLDDVSLTPEQKQQIINKINEISQIRLNLYSSLKNIYSSYKQNISSSRNTLSQSIETIDILENELNQSKLKMNLIENEKNNKLRLVEINTYFGKQYNAHSKLMKTIVFICIPIIILTLLYNNSILPSNIYTLLLVIILVIGVLLIGMQLIDMSNRDDMNWDEYDWYFNKEKAEKNVPYTTNNYEYSNNPWKTPTVTCIGSACCYSGSTYDSVKNVCIPNNLYNTNEGFRGLDKYGHAQIKTFPVDNTVSSLSKF